MPALRQLFAIFEEHKHTPDSSESTNLGNREEQLQHCGKAVQPMELSNKSNVSTPEMRETESPKTIHSRDSMIPRSAGMGCCAKDQMDMMDNSDLIYPDKETLKSPRVSRRISPLASPRGSPRVCPWLDSPGLESSYSCTIEGGTK